MCVGGFGELIITVKYGKGGLHAGVDSQEVEEEGRKVANGIHGNFSSPLTLGILLKNTIKVSGCVCDKGY